MRGKLIGVVVTPLIQLFIVKPNNAKSTQERISEVRATTFHFDHNRRSDTPALPCFSYLFVFIWHRHFISKIERQSAPFEQKPMNFSHPKRLWSLHTLLAIILFTPFVFLTSGCTKSEPISTTPAISPAQSMANRIKSVEDDPRMPADAKAREIARIKAENR
jgi:hypothetical protein